MKKTLLLLAGLAMLLSSCQKESFDDGSSKEMPENFVDKQTIRGLLGEVSQQNLTRSSGEQSFGTISTIDAVNGNDGIPDFYVINYKGGGFVIMAADDRVNPILAFSDENSFPVNVDKYSLGLEMWLENADYMVNEVRASNEKQSEEVAEQWTPEMIASFLTHMESGEGRHAIETRSSGEVTTCTCRTIQYGPFFNNQDWSQGLSPYNDAAPLLYINPLNHSAGQQRALTGCTALAMGQIIYFYRWPNKPTYQNFNYAGIAIMVRECGDALGNKWGLSGTYASDKNIDGSLTQKFSYRSANYANYGLAPVRNDLSGGRPVILGAHNTGHAIGIPYADEGHNWVCDGFQQYQMCYSVTHGSQYYIYPAYLNMRWGWGGAHNGWYQEGVWDIPGKIYFNRKRTMITNMVPNR